ncbi:hypothetical protein D3C87_1986740 [compost metagenome]
MLSLPRLEAYRKRPLASIWISEARLLPVKLSGSAESTWKGERAAVSGATR